MGTISSLYSLAKAGMVLAREGVISAIPSEPLPPAARMGQKIAGLIERRHAKNRAQSERLSIALNKLGPSWVKIGQFLATRADVIGVEMARDLELLQDRMEMFPTKQAKTQVEESLGRKIEDMFSDFSEPIAAASIAQVHKGVRKSDGKSVAVKVIRPGVRKRFLHDLETFYTAAHLQEKYIPASRRLKPVAVADMLAQSAKIEMDLRLEAAGFSEMAENTKDDPKFRVPEIDWELSGRDCVTMEWIDGIKLSNIEAIEAAGHDRKELAANLIQSFLRHALRDGFFHADMHPGNLFVDARGDIVAVDLGIAGRLKKKERRALAEILYGFIKRDYVRVAEVHFEIGYVPRTQDVASFAQAIRAIGEPIHGQSAETISMAKLLMLLFEITDLFEMEARPELLLLQKTMAVVEGVARTLDPSFNMWAASEPVVSDWMKRNLGPVGIGEDMREGAKAGVALARQLPELAERAERLSKEMEATSQNGFRLDEKTIEEIGKAEAAHSRTGHMALWVIAALGAYALFIH
ncbi:MAG: 2-polyprenylphenol 6-hydroxylase [Nitratireductor sp.]